MAEYLLIESRDPFESNDVGYYYELAKGLVEGGNKVTLFLAQNGVLSVRPSARSAALGELARSGVTVLADDFSFLDGMFTYMRLHDWPEAPVRPLIFPEDKFGINLPDSPKHWLNALGRCP